MSRRKETVVGGFDYVCAVVGGLLVYGHWKKDAERPVQILIPVEEFVLVEKAIAEWRTTIGNNLPDESVKHAKPKPTKPPVKQGIKIIDVGD